MTKDVARLQQELVDLQERVVKIAELEVQTKKLSEARSGLLAQVKQLATELDTAKSAEKEAKTKNESLMRENANKDQEIEDLSARNNDLLSTQKEIQLFKSENSKLNTTIDELRAGGVAQPVGGVAISDDEKKALESKVRGLEESVREWTDLAKVSCILAINTSGNHWAKAKIITALLQGVQGHASYLQASRRLPQGRRRVGKRDQ